MPLAAAVAALVVTVSGCAVEGTPHANPTISSVEMSTPYIGDSGPSNLPPPPADYATMSCRAYTVAPEPVQQSVVKAILGPDKKNVSLNATLANLMCMRSPDSTVVDALTSIRPGILN